jgi:hypothetical protein
LLVLRIEAEGAGDPRDIGMNTISESWKRVFSLQVILGR